jgi:putative transposase
MPRIPRVIAENIPHHVVQRGHRRQKVFLSDQDKILYLDILRGRAQQWGVSFWAYCLMDNHVHFVCVPRRSDALSKCFQEVNKAYARKINFREGWRGSMWEGRFRSFPMDESYLFAAIRYVEQNPVRAGMVRRAEDYAFSSAAAHVGKEGDNLLEPFFLQDQIGDWREYLTSGDDRYDGIEEHLNTGRPFGSAKFVDDLEKILKRPLQKAKPGPKKLSADEGFVPLLPGITN